MSDQSPIPHSGACITSKNALFGEGRIKWMIREEPAHVADNGWRVWSDIDDSDYLDNPDNVVVTEYNELCDIEPLLVAIYDFPVGSDLQIVDDEAGKRIVHTPTGEVVPPESYFVVPPGAQR